MLLELLKKLEKEKDKLLTEKTKLVEENEKLNLQLIYNGKENAARI